MNYSKLTRLLAGFFEPAALEAYVQSSVQIDASAINPAVFSEAYVHARAYVAALEARTESTCTPLGEHPHLHALKKESSFQEFTGPVDLVMVDPRFLIVTQPRINATYTRELASRVPAPGDTEALLQYCVPLQREAPRTEIRASFTQTTQTLSFVTEHPDFRICGPMVDTAAGDNGRAVLGFWIGPGSQQMNVSCTQGRYALHNGHHRATALVAAGHTEIPVLLRHGEIVEYGQRTRVFPPSVLQGPKPPRIVDFTSAAALELPLRRVRTLYSVQASMHTVVD